MSARLYALRRCQPAEFASTAGHTEGFVTQPAAAGEQIEAREGLHQVDTRRLCRHRAVTDAEALAAEQLRRETVERLADDRITRRTWLLWAVVFIGTLIASHYFPGVWGYGWTP